jgi:hypothetical protein
MPDPRGPRRLLGDVAAICAYAAASPAESEVNAAMRLLADIEGHWRATLDQAEAKASLLEAAGIRRPGAGEPVLRAQFFFALAA